MELDILYVFVDDNNLTSNFGSPCSVQCTYVDKKENLSAERNIISYRQGCLTRGEERSMVRLKSFQFFYWLVVITFVGLMGLVTFIRPLDHKQQELLQAIDREPLVLL